MEKQPNIHKSGDEDKMGRRDFLKKAAMLGGAVALTTGGYGVLNKIAEVKEGPLRSRAVVLKKEYQPAGAFPIGGTLMPVPEKWTISLQVDDDLVWSDGNPVPEIMEVSKDEYDQFEVGNEMYLSYKIRGIGLGKHREGVQIER